MESIPGHMSRKSSAAGIMSVDNGQTEAGRSLGFSYIETMWFIVLPQAVKKYYFRHLPMSSLRLLRKRRLQGYVGLTDLTRGANIIRGLTYQSFMPLIAAALIYLAMVMFFTWLVGKLERRLRNGE